MRADKKSLVIDGLWLPICGALHLRVGEVMRAAMRLFDGRLAFECVRRCWAHLVHRALRSLAPGATPTAFQLRGGGPGGLPFSHFHL